MEQKLFTELRTLYTTTKETPTEIRIRIRMRDLIDPAILRCAVDMTMRRYPYFCVELQKKEGRYVYVENHRPVVITNSLHGVDLILLLLRTLQCHVERRWYPSGRR